MVTLAIDYAWSGPPAKDIAAAGYSSVIRYLSTDTTKNLTLAEAQALHAAGLSIGLIWETTAQRALSGGNGGISDAQEAVTQASNLHYHTGCVLFCNIGDWAVETDQLAAITQYFNGWSAYVTQHQYTTGGYTTGYVIDKLANTINAIWWQNGIDDQGEPGRNVNQATSIYQRTKPTTALKGSFDENVILKPIPLWGPATIPLGGQPPPSPPATPHPVNSYPVFPGRLLYLHQPFIQGNDVRTWQQQMRNRRWAITVDGVFGPQTENVCKQFQAQKKLVVDGIVGKVTWEAAWTLPITP